MFFRSRSQMMENGSPSMLPGSTSFFGLQSQVPWAIREPTIRDEVPPLWTLLPQHVKDWAIKEANDLVLNVIMDEEEAEKYGGLNRYTAYVMKGKKRYIYEFS